MRWSKQRNVKFKCLVGFSGEVQLVKGGEKFSEKNLNLTLDCKEEVPIGLNILKS